MRIGGNNRPWLRGRGMKGRLKLPPTMYVCVCVYVPEDKLEMEGKVIALEEKRLC